MCEINPKHSLFFKIEAFTSNPNMSKDEFERTVNEKLIAVEQELNKDFRFRFHIHSDERKKK